MENQALDNEKSLAIIAEMIATTRNNISQDGFHFLLWGIILVICCIVQFIMIYFLQLPEESNLVWLLMPFVGVPISIWYGKTRDAQRKVKTFADTFYKFIWFGFGVSLFCTLLLTNYYQKTPTFFIMVLTGFAVFSSGIILKFKPLLYGAIVFWVGSLTAFLAPSDAVILLVFAISLIFGYIVPGFLLRKQYKSSLTNV